MSYKKQEFEWSVPLSEVQVGIPIGYEVQFSQKPSYYPVLFTLTTYKEVTESAQGTFYYSLDNGATWIDFPIGENGHAFYSAYRMKLVVNSAETSYIFAEKSGSIYRITPDGSRILETYTIDDFTSSAFENDARNNTLYTAGQNNTLYKVESYQKLEEGDNSLNIHSDPLGIVIDSTRRSFWQINRDKIFLKELDGDAIFSINLPFNIEIS